jgi:uridine nucleosidase
MHPPVEIHGHSGLDGVLHMPPLSHPTVQHFYTQSDNNEVNAQDEAEVPAIPALIAALESLPQDEKMTIVITGPCTNIARLRQLEPTLYDRKVDQVVIMGGSLGIPQWTEHSEFNINVDPDALWELNQSTTVRLVIVPLNITHQAIFDRKVHARLLDP